LLKANPKKANQFPENLFGIKRERANKSKDALPFKHQTPWTLCMSKGLITKRRAEDEFNKATNVKPNQKP